ncbi:hypothetical protein Tco_0863321 [Tanacetum coccineum]
MAAGATMVIGGVEIDVVYCCSTGMILVTEGGGERVVTGVTIGISGIDERIIGSGIIETDSLVVAIKEVSEDRLRN